MELEDKAHENLEDQHPSARSLKFRYENLEDRHHSACTLKKYVKEIKAPFGWGENMEDEKKKKERKIGWKMEFSLVCFREKRREKENGAKNNPSGPT